MCDDDKSIRPAWLLLISVLCILACLGTAVMSRRLYHDTGNGPVTAFLLSFFCVPLLVTGVLYIRLFLVRSYYEKTKPERKYSCAEPVRSMCEKISRTLADIGEGEFTDSGFRFVVKKRMKKVYLDKEKILELESGYVPLVRERNLVYLKPIWTVALQHNAQLRKEKADRRAIDSEYIRALIE